MAPATLFSATSRPLSAPLPPHPSSRRLHFAQPRPAKAGSCCRLGPVGAWQQPSSERRRAAVRCNGAARFIAQSEFAAEVLQSELPVLVDFVADWCGPCRLIAPAIDWASQEFEGRLKIVKIDHDSNPELIEEYKIYGLPTLIIFKEGEEVPNSRQEGALTKAKMKEYLDSMLDQITH